MTTFQKISICFLLALLVAVPSQAQVSLTSTTLSAAVTTTSGNIITVASATGFTAGTTSVFISDGVAGEFANVRAVSGTTITLINRTKPTTHASGALVYVGLTNYFSRSDRAGSCTAANELVLPVINVLNGKRFDCVNSLWGAVADGAFYVPPTQCTFAPTTLTVTNTYPQIGASNLFVLKGISNAAAGTMTLTCNIMVPTQVSALKGAYLKDITLFLASSATGSGVVPTSVGTSTLGSITFPAAATTETASTVTPVTIGGTVTTTGAGATGFLTAVTTDGAFYTIKHTYSTAVDLSTDLRILQYTFPVLQSAASVSTLYTPGLLVHYRAAAGY